MPILPQVALFVILQSWSLVLQLVSHFWYERQLARYHDYWLVQLDQIADLTPLEQACAGFHVGSGPGSAVTHPVPRLVRALLIRYLYHRSWRQTEELIDTFGLQARAAKTYLIELIRDLCRHLLTHLEQIDPDCHAALVADLDLTALFEAEDDKITAALKAPQRAERLQYVGRQALRLARLLTA